MPIPFWPFFSQPSVSQDPLNQVWSLGWKTPMRAFVGSVGVVPTATYALGEMQETTMDEQPEEEHPWWNIVLAPNE